MVYGAEFGVVFLAQGPRTAFIQEGLDFLDLYYRGLVGERDLRLVVELTYVPPNEHTACAGPPGNFNGVCSGFRSRCRLRRAVGRVARPLQLTQSSTVYAVEACT